MQAYRRHSVLLFAFCLSCLAATAHSAPQDILGMCRDGSMVLNGERQTGLTMQQLQASDERLVNLLAGHGIELHGRPITDQVLQSAVTTIAMAEHNIETNQAIQGGSGRLGLRTYWADPDTLLEFVVLLAAADDGEHGTLTLGDITLPEKRIGREAQPRLIRLIQEALSRNAPLVYSNEHHNSKLQLFPGYLNDGVDTLLRVCAVASN